ncbi:feruloyl-CoA synthase [Roseateles sp. LYH14W]|uniref:Feruloyl-CoA synthase n=1 Tax=Pelomonas parva TaxID=3299032 RepID=A0ABW7F1L6_9BURK
MSAAAPYRPVAFGPYGAEITPQPDGGWLIRAHQPIAAYPRRFTEHLLHWAATAPDRSFLAQRERGPLGTPGRPWRHLSYAEAAAQVKALGQALLDLGLSAERPLMLLSGNDIEHALLTLAAMHVGVPVAPISPAYSRLDPQAAKVAQAVALLQPGLVFAADGDAFGPALDKALTQGRPGTPVLLTHGHRPGALRMLDLLRTVATPAVDAAHERVSADTVAKLLFTSGSTQAPKAVINTHRMLCANQQMYAQCYPFLEEEPPVLVDWLPWHHTAGGNANFGLVLRNGGSLYIDEGKPTEDGMAETVLNLMDVSPTAIYTVPKGLEMLAHHMAQDPALRDRVLARLKLIFAAGAAMPQSVIELVDRLATEALGQRIPMTMGLGMTESGPFAVSHHLPGWRQGIVGLPAPGLDLKLAPVGDKLELRYRGPSITPGYWGQPELTAAAFDDDGFFCSGDAAQWIDPAQPARGLRFDGRIAEDFKLITGTWANVGQLRARAMADALPYMHDVVVTGDGRDALGLLVFFAPAAAELAAPGTPHDPAAWAADPAVRAWAQRWLDALAATGTGSSNRITRALLVPAAPSAAQGEVTDKGSLNQRAVLRARVALVERLYAEPPPADVLLANEGQR